jgi:hypothetical protein
MTHVIVGTKLLNVDHLVVAERRAGELCLTFTDGRELRFQGSEAERLASDLASGPADWQTKARLPEVERWVKGQIAKPDPH